MTHPMHPLAGGQPAAAPPTSGERLRDAATARCASRAARAALAAPLFLLAACGGGTADPQASSAPMPTPQILAARQPATPPAIFAPEATPFGASYAEWSARWWQWALAIPADRSPFADKGGCRNGAEGQAGPVWFLAGVINKTGSAHRTCDVPAGKAILIPVVNVECSTLEGNGRNTPQLRACLAQYRFGNVSATIDGVPVADLERYLVESPPFDLTLPENNVLGVDAGTGTAIGKGYYLMLPPLAAGSSHVLEYGGGFPDFDFAVSMRYELHVTAPAQAAAR